MQTNSALFTIFIDEAMKFVDSQVPTVINKGGCGIFAKDLAREFEKYGINYKIYAVFFPEQKTMTVEDEEQEIFNNLIKFKEGKCEPKKAGIGHVIIVVDDMIAIDSQGVENFIFNSAVLKTELTLSQLEELDNEKSIWNKVFDRSQEPVIQKLLDQVFEKLEEFKPGTYKLGKPVTYTDYTIERLQSQNPFAALLR